MNLQTFASFILLLALALLVNTAESKRRNRMKPSQPNIIFILMDDLDIQLGSMEVMTKTRSIFEENGTEFVNAFVTSPICCPSRSSILTGMYAHNHGCMTNTVNCASMAWRRGPERKTFGAYLQESGYRTGYFGKYLNNYDGSWIPHGWDSWTGLIKNSKFYNYTLNVNNKKVHHGNNYERDYFTDVVTRHSAEFFHESRENEPEKPVMMVLSMSAPHGPEDPAPHHQHMLENITAPRYPNFNVHSPDKHWLLQYTKPMNSQKIAFSDLLHRRRLLTLLSVDDAIDRLYKSLVSRDLLENTYIFLSSDHGYHLGQFGLAKGKSMPYETDIRIPFYALGPKIPKAQKIKDIVLNIDLAPTFLDLGNTRVPGSMDGRSIMDIFDSYRDRTNVANWRDSFLVEKSKSTYASKYKSRKSAGDEHSQSKVKMIKKQCRSLMHQSPCTNGQQWTCVKHNGQLRFRKCRSPTEELRKTARIPRSVEKRCKCSKKDKGRSGSRRHKKRYVEHNRHHRRYYKSDKAKKELKKLQNYEHHLQKESSASYSKKVYEKAVQFRLRKIKMRIQASRKRLATLRLLKKSIVQMMDKPTSVPSTSCHCVNGKAMQVERVTEWDKYSVHRPPYRTYSKKVQGKRLKSGKVSKKNVKKQRRKTNACLMRGLNCFQHTDNHWKTEPLWTNGSFCFCPTSSNNTYWCLRTINDTHNFLYCEFATSFCEYFDLNEDPFQLTNAIHTLSHGFHDHLHRQLEYLGNCRHTSGCDMYPGRAVPQKAFYPLEKACTNRNYTT